MGLDIVQGFDITENEDFALHYFGEYDKMSVSRSFCNFMCRKGVVEGEADLDQIGRILKVDISAIYEMETYTDEWELEEILDFEDDPEAVKKEIEEQNSKVVGNIDSVISTAVALIAELEKARDISGKIDNNGYETIHNSYYQELNTTAEVDCIDNNLVQDLRNLLRASQFAKSKGAKTTFFSYG